MTEARTEGGGVTRRKLQEVLQRDLYNRTNHDDPTPRSAVDIDPVAEISENGLGRMILEFTDDGGLKTTITTTED